MTAAVVVANGPFKVIPGAAWVTAKVVGGESEVDALAKFFAGSISLPDLIFFASWFGERFPELETLARMRAEPCKTRKDKA